MFLDLAVTTKSLLSNKEEAATCWEKSLIGKRVSALISYPPVTLVGCSLATFWILFKTAKMVKVKITIPNIDMVSPVRKVEATGYAIAVLRTA